MQKLLVLILSISLMTMLHTINAMNLLQNQLLESTCTAKTILEYTQGDLTIRSRNNSSTSIVTYIQGDRESNNSILLITTATKNKKKLYYFATLSIRTTNDKGSIDCTTKFLDDTCAQEVFEELLKKKSKK